MTLWMIRILCDSFIVLARRNFNAVAAVVL